MKFNVFYILFLLVFFSFNSIAQKNNYGIQGSINISSLLLSEKPTYPNTDEIVFYEPMLSYSISAYYEKISEKKYFFSIEPGYARKGAIENIYNRNEKAILELHYIQFPIFFNIYLFNNTYLSAGLETSYLVNANYKLNDECIRIKHMYEEFIDLAGLTGLNYQLTEKININIRYSHSLFSISKILWFNDPFGQPTGDLVKERNQSFMLALRFKVFSR